MLDKTSNIFREKALVESYGGRIHFTTGETFSSTKLSHFLLSSPEAAQDNPLLRNDRVLFRDLSEPRLHARGAQELPRRGEPAARLPARRDDHRRVGGRHRRRTCRRSRGAWPASRPARSRQIGGAGIVALHLAGFVKQRRTASPTAWSGDAAGQRHGDARSPTTRSSRRASSTRTPAIRCSNRRARDLPACSAIGCPNFDDYDLVLIADFGHGLLDADSDQRADRRATGARSSPPWCR